MWASRATRRTRRLEAFGLRSRSSSRAPSMSKPESSTTGTTFTSVFRLFVFICRLSCCFRHRLHLFQCRVTCTTDALCHLYLLLWKLCSRSIVNRFCLPWQCSGVIGGAYFVQSNRCSTSQRRRVELRRRRVLYRHKRARTSRHTLWPRLSKMSGPKTGVRVWGRGQGKRGRWIRLRDMNDARLSHGLAGSSSSRPAAPSGRKGRVRLHDVHFRCFMLLLVNDTLLLFHVDVYFLFFFVCASTRVK